MAHTTEGNLVMEVKPQRGTRKCQKDEKRRNKTKVQSQHDRDDSRANINKDTKRGRGESGGEGARRGKERKGKEMQPRKEGRLQ